MAKPVVSPWTITFDLGGPNEHVLASPGLKLEEEPQGLGSTQETEAGDYIEADDSEPMARGKVKKRFGLTVYREHASEAAARDYMFQLDQAIPVNVQGVLTVVFTGGSTWTLSPSVFKTWNTVPVRYSNPPRTATTYELECGALSLGTPAGPDPIGLDEAVINLTRASGMLDAGGDAAAHREALATWTNTGTEDDATQATAGNRPLLMEGKALYLPGVAGNYYGSQGTNATSQFQVRWAGILPSYTPAARVCLAGDWDEPGEHRSWALFLEPSGCVTLAVSSGGTAATVTEWTSALPIGMPGGSFVALEVTRGPVALTFYLYASLAWTSPIVFSPNLVAAPVVPFGSTAPLTIGSTSTGTLHLGQMRVHYVSFTANINSGAAPMIFDFAGDTSNYAGVVTGEAGTDPMTVMTREGNWSARFDGSNDSLALATPVPLNAVDGLSFFLHADLFRTTGDNDLLFFGSNDADPRVLLRVDDGVLKLIIRRLDGEATVELSTNFFSWYISASIDFAAGTATLYQNREAKAAAALTSAGPTSATDSSETRLMAGAAGANPAAGEVYALHVVERATNPFEHAALWDSIIAANS